MIPFIMRTVMIYCMGVQYLGLNSLFTSILQVLNLAELGVGSAMVYSMYKPISEDDTNTICALMRLYRTYYRCIGLIIAVIGVGLTPFMLKRLGVVIPSTILTLLMAVGFSTPVFAYVAECLEFTFAGEFHDHLTMEEALEVYDKIPSERMNADKCIGFCIEEDGGFVGMYELVVNDKVQRENINSINYFRDDKLVQQAISDMEKLMAARQQSKEQERGSTKKSVLDALRSLKAKKQEQPAQEQDKPKKAKKKGMEL